MTAFFLRCFVRAPVDSPAGRAAVGRLAGIVGIACNLLLFLGKLLAGLAAGSVSILADALNNLSDASSSVVTLLGFSMAQRPADRDHPYGHARYEYLSGLVVAGLIFLIGAELAKSSLGKILHPAPVALSALSFAVLVGSIAVKLWMRSFVGALGRRIHSATLLAAATDSRNDALASTAVLAGCLIQRFTGVHIDGCIGLAVAVFILVSGVGVAKETISPLLGRQADPAFLDRLRQLLLSHDRVLGIHDLLVHDYGPGQCHASVHVELSAEEDPLVCHDLIDDMERAAWEQLNVQLVIHYDPVVVNDAERDEMQQLVQEVLRTLHPQLSMHDFRLVRGAQQTKLVFDLAVPYALTDQRQRFQQQIDEALRRQGKQYQTVIRFDAAE